MCKKQTSVSHSSTEAHIISLDASLRMDGIPALTFWDFVIEVFHSAPNKTDGPKRGSRGNPSAVVEPNMHNPIPTKHTNVIPTNIDHIPPNGTHSGHGAMLYVFEDNEAVSKMIIKGRSPTMRHVSRTHRVARDWLFDRINLRPQDPNSLHWHQTNINSQTFWPKGISHVTNATIFFICLISTISAPLAALRISAVGGKTSIHFNGSTQNIELLLQMVISVNQLSLYGAVADMCYELPVGQRAVVKPKAPGQLDKVRLSTSNDLKNCQKTRSYPNNAPKQIWD